MWFEYTCSWRSEGKYNFNIANLKPAYAKASTFVINSADNSVVEVKKLMNGTERME